MFSSSSLAFVRHSYYGTDRITNDIDLVADVREEHAAPLEARLGNDYYADAQMIRQAVQRRSSFNFISFDNGLKVDVFTLKPQPFMQEQMRRRRQGPLAVKYNPTFAGYQRQTSCEIPLVALRPIPEP